MTSREGVQPKHSFHARAREGVQPLHKPEASREGVQPLHTYAIRADRASEDAGASRPRTRGCATTALWCVQPLHT
jgi:hypothetical protein